MNKVTSLVIVCGFVMFYMLITEVYNSNAAPVPLPPQASENLLKTVRAERAAQEFERTNIAAADRVVLNTSSAHMVSKGRVSLVLTNYCNFSNGFYLVKVKLENKDTVYAFMPSPDYQVTAGTFVSVVFIHSSHVNPDDSFSPASVANIAYKVDQF